MRINTPEGLRNQLERGKGKRATGALGSPRSFTGDNGGEVLQVIRGLYELGGCEVGFEGA